MGPTVVVKNERFDSVVFDETSADLSDRLTALLINIEDIVEDEIAIESDAKVQALVHLEECGMWLNKAIRDKQIKADADKPENQPIEAQPETAEGTEDV